MFKHHCTPFHSPLILDHALSLSTKMQADFQIWYEPLMQDSAEKRLVEGKAPTHSPRVPFSHKNGDRVNENRENQDAVASEGSWEGRGGNTPTRIPRPPVDAWGTPPAAADRREPSKAVDSSGRHSGAPSREGGHALHGSVGAVGLLPPLTGEYNFDILLCFWRFLRGNVICYIRQLELHDWYEGSSFCKTCESSISRCHVSVSLCS